VKPPAPLRGSETILVVEDDESSRMLAFELLTDLGYRVIQASSGHAALEAAALHEGPVHLLLTDLLMPGMNGRELSLEFARLHPETKVLFISGYDPDEIVRHGVLKPGTVMLQKPFDVDTLARKVREILRLPAPPTR
jgi:two-component system cell cycle sensor histidine kinase/response regulator CckA